MAKMTISPHRKMLWLEDEDGFMVQSNDTNNALKRLTEIAKIEAKKHPNKLYVITEPIRKIEYLKKVM